MGYSGCPCYNDYYRINRQYCDENGQSCGNCPLVEEARRRNNSR